MTQEDVRPNMRRLRVRKTQICRSCNRKLLPKTLVMCHSSFEPSLNDWFSTYYCPNYECTKPHEQVSLDLFNPES